MKSRRILAVLLTAAMVMLGLAGTGTKAAAAQSTIQLASGTNRNIVVEPGTTTHVKLPVIAVGEYILNPSVAAEAENGAPFTVTGVKLTKDNVEGNVPGISTYDPTNLEFDVAVKDTAKIKDYKVVFTFTYNSTDSDGYPTTEKVPLEVNLQVLTEKAPAQLTIDEVEFDENRVAIGGSFDLSFLVKNEGEIQALNTFVSVEYGDTGMVPAYTVESIKVGDLAQGKSRKVQLPIAVLANASEGLKTLRVNMTYKDTEGTEYTASRSIYITILKSGTGDVNDANLVIEGPSYTEGIAAGTKLSVPFTITNTGAETAKSVSVSIVEGAGASNSVIPDFAGDSISAGSIKAGAAKQISLPLIITKDAASGLREITVQVKYLNSEGKQCTAVTKIYLSVAAAASAEVKNEVTISGVTQNPSAPQAGENLSVNFTISNKGTNTISDVKMSASNLSGAGFEPVSSEPYQQIGSIEAGQTKNVTMNFKVGNNIPEGMNTLTLCCTYTDASGAEHREETMVYILNVQNDGGTLSKPKLIISDFSTVPDPEKGNLRAGSYFDFVLEIENTHASVAARSIKVTLNQSENIFTVAEGSSSFYIASIRPGEKAVTTIRMKVKNDAATKSYSLDITIEYDYDGMKATENSDGSVSVKDTLNLQAVENARPDVQNIYVGNGWETPTVNQSTTMNFDFYNKGQSTLNNVEFMVEGDYQFETGTTYYLGNIQGGSSEYCDISIIPLAEGQVQGVLICSFEDSNGDKQEMRYEFESTIQGEYIPVYDPEFGGGSDPYIPTPQAKEPILPTWMFLCIQAAILIVGIPLTRKIVLGLHRRKLMKQEEME